MITVMMMTMINAMLVFALHPRFLLQHFDLLALRSPSRGP